MRRTLSRPLLAAVLLALAPASAQAPLPRVQTLVAGLDTPWAIDFAPDGRIFLTERPGRVRVVRGGRLDPTPWLTLPVVESGESGLLGLALDPSFATNRYAYAAYTVRDDRGRFVNRLARLREDPRTGRGSLDRVLLDSVPAANNHDGGRVRFGPDGKLYWTVGDAQEPARAQDRSSLNGKILRLNPDGTVPADNPFPGSPVWSLGHRNSQGLAWQPGTGRLFALEHGPSGAASCCDEINLIRKGANYGWPTVQGERTAAGLVAPLAISGTDPESTWAPGGAAFVTRGPWAGSLLFAGLRGQALYRATIAGGDTPRVTSVRAVFQGEFGRLRDVAEGPDGRIYVLTSNEDGRGRSTPQGDRVLVLAWE